MNNTNFIAIIVAVVLGTVALTVVGGSWYTIDQGERGVILRNGALIGQAGPGLGFKIPVIDSVVAISTQVRTKVYEGAEAYSRDQQPATLAYSVTYRLPEAQIGEIYSDFGSEEALVFRLLDRNVYDAVRNVFGQYNAVDAIQKREQLRLDMSEAIRQAVVGPIEITGLQLEDIKFSRAYENSIEQRMLAEVEVQRVRQNAERERITAEITVIQAEATAKARIEQATAEAQAITLQGQAEATAIRARGAALRDNPTLIQLVQAERWNGVLPTTMIPNSTVPFLNTNPDSR